ncbi:metalloprotease [Salmonella bongori]|nr:metalloprotease [Salmonella bongori]
MTLLTSLRQWLSERQLDAILISSRPNKQPHLGISSGSGFVLISHRHAHILVDARYYADVKARTNGYCIHLLGGGQTLTSLVNHIIAAENLQTMGF